MLLVEEAVVEAVAEEEETVVVEVVATRKVVASPWKVYHYYLLVQVADVAGAVVVVADAGDVAGCEYILHILLEHPRNHFSVSSEFQEPHDAAAAAA